MCQREEDKEVEEKDKEEEEEQRERHLLSVKRMRRGFKAGNVLKLQKGQVQEEHTSGFIRSKVQRNQTSVC